MPTLLYTHFQLPHHELLGHMVPPGVSEDGGMAKIMLQTPALGLEREAGQEQRRNAGVMEEATWAPSSRSPTIAPPTTMLH